jgi:hypothetical protein
MSATGAIPCPESCPESPSDLSAAAVTIQHVRSLSFPAYIRPPGLDFRSHHQAPRHSGRATSGPDLRSSDATSVVEVASLVQSQFSFLASARTALSTSLAFASSSLVTCFWAFSAALSMASSIVLSPTISRAA